MRGVACGPECRRQGGVFAKSQLAPQVLATLLELAGLFIIIKVHLCRRGLARLARHARHNLLLLLQIPLTNKCLHCFVTDGVGDVDLLRTIGKGSLLYA
jgi:hypothetical protein